ncbi:MAG: MFS transporter, partial [Anaerolineae bacterium]|nr:MFS transporter [Anaerolineae bacterium]
MDRELRWYDYLTINSYWFALTTRSQTLSPLVVPLLVQRFVGETVKGTFVGRMRLWSLMVAVLVQAAMGLFSDRNTLRWGRRRPFILVGTLGELVIFALIGLTASMEGMAGYWSLFALYTLSMVASNTAHAATQGLIPDLVPEEKRGRASGIKALLELPVPLIFSSFVIAKMIEGGNLWGALVTLMTVMVVSMAITMFVPEERLRIPPKDGIGETLVRLALMTGAFTVVILGTGAVANVVLRGFAALAGGWTTVLTVLAGVITMGGAVLVGVWASVAISLGGDVREHHSFVWWVTNRLAFLVAATNLATFMVYFLQERFVDLPGEKAAGPAAQVMMFVGIFIMVTAVPSGWLADRFGKRLLVAVAGAVAAVGIAVILLVPTIPALYLAGSLIGAAMGLFYSANWALGTEIVPPKEAGRYLGLSNVAGAGAGAIGAYIGGPIADQHGYVVLFTIYGAL